MGVMARLWWKLRKGVWNRIAQIKLKNNQPLAVTRLKKSRRTITAIPFTDVRVCGIRVFRDIPVPSLKAAQKIPRDDKYPLWQYLKKMIVFGLQLWACRRSPGAWSPMQAGLPPVDADPFTAMREGYTSRHARIAKKAAAKMSVERPRLLQPPMLPPELRGNPDLGMLAVRGPYAGYLKRVEGDEYAWDLQSLSAGDYEPHAGLYKPWARVLFRFDDRARRLNATEIHTELGTTRPGDRDWSLAKKLALCAVSTHTGLVRHWNWLHLTTGEYFAIATRNAFAEHHPLCRLLWPHIFGTQQSNRFGNMAQLTRGGDFEHIYSFTHAGMCHVLERSAKEFDMMVGDPVADAARRNVSHLGVDALPTQKNLEDLFAVIHRHARRYLGIYYKTDRDVQTNEPIEKWLDELNKLMPTGVQVSKNTVTLDSLARLIARFIYLVTAYHEMVGACLWNYQMWTHVHPIRVYKDGRREPLDVYQRLVNTNYLLQVIRAPLIADYSRLAPDEEAKGAFTAFRTELETLQQTMEQEPWAFWKLYPNMLEGNINA